MGSLREKIWFNNIAIYWAYELQRIGLILHVIYVIKCNYKWSIAERENAARISLLTHFGQIFIWLCFDSCNRRYFGCKFVSIYNDYSKLKSAIPAVCHVHTLRVCGRTRCLNGQLLDRTGWMITLFSTMTIKQIVNDIKLGRVLLCAKIVFLQHCSTEIWPIFPWSIECERPLWQS